MVEDMGVTASMAMKDRGAWILVRYWEQLVWAKLNQLCRLRLCSYNLLLLTLSAMLLMQLPLLSGGANILKIIIFSPSAEGGSGGGSVCVGGSGGVVVLAAAAARWRGNLLARALIKN